MTPLILDVEQGGHHATDQEDKDGHNNYLGRVMKSLLKLMVLRVMMNTKMVTLMKRIEIGTVL